MKTVEEVLYDCTGMLAENHPSIVEAMKVYALEVCKESLRLASDNARIEERDVDYKKIKLVDFGRYSFRGDESPVEVYINKQSILSEDNIPKEVKS